MGAVAELREEVEAYKNELRNLWYYKKKVKEIEDEIAVLEYEMEGVKGIDYSKQRGSYNPSIAEQRRLAMIEKMERLQKEKEKREEKEKHACRYLMYMSDEDRDLVVSVIADKRKYREVCKERKIPSTSTLANTINLAIAKAIKKAGS